MSQFILHPIACIQQAKQNFQFGIQKPVKLRTTPTNFVSIKKDITNRIAQYNGLTSASMKEHSLETDKDILQFQEIGRRDILHSAFGQEFLQKYEADIQHEQTFEKLLLFVTEIIGHQTEKQKIKEAKAELESATRNIEHDERFTRFLDKLRRIAQPISNNEEIRSYLITEAFHKNINRGLRTFLHEHEKNNESIDDIAKYLDRMNKHKTSHVNQLEIDVATKKISELCLQNDKLQSQNHTIEEKLDNLKLEMQQMIAAAIAHSTTELNKIGATKTVEAHNQRPGNKTTSKAGTRQSYNPRWELDRFGAPIQCNKCGWKGHKAANCLGLIRCSLCREQGHAITICPKRKTNSITKNE